MAPAMHPAFLRRALIALVLSACAAQSPAQDGNFTPFVISADEVVNRMDIEQTFRIVKERIRGERMEGEILTGTRAPERMAWSAQRQ